MYTVLQVVPELESGGVERTTIDVARAIVKAGGRALIATAGGRMTDEVERIGARVFVGAYQSKNPWRIWRNASELEAIIRNEDVSVVHARSRAPAWSALWASRRTGTPFVTTYAGIHKAKSALKRSYNAVMASGDIVIANSNFTANHVRAEYKIAEDRLVTIPRGIDIAAFTPASVSPERVRDVRNQWGAGNQPVVLLPGRLSRLKGHANFLEALARLSHRNVLAVLAGGGGSSRDRYVTQLKQQIVSLGLERRVLMPGHVADMPAANLASNVVVSPSLVPESFGRTAVEAQAMGRPLVATALGGQLETVEDGVTGFLVQPNDVDGLARAIDRALDLEVATLRTMAIVQRERVTKSYTVDAMCAATLRVYERLGRRPSPKLAA